MIAYLASRDANFGQVIAVDAEFNLFSRAWCVAELAEAHKLSMHQVMMVRSHITLDRNESMLRGLRVEHMEASRPEDVQAILSKISNVEQFNKELQALIFHIVADWRGLDSME